jgi:hypothetical protein
MCSAHACGCILAVHFYESLHLGADAGGLLTLGAPLMTYVQLLHKHTQTELMV